MFIIPEERNPDFDCIVKDLSVCVSLSSDLGCDRGKKESDLLIPYGAAQLEILSSPDAQVPLDLDTDIPSPHNHSTIFTISTMNVVEKIRIRKQRMVRRKKTPAIAERLIFTDNFVKFGFIILSQSIA